MKTVFINFSKIFIVFLILVLSFWLRKRNYAEIPIPGQSVDEYSYSWVGLSLIELGIPVGVSGIPGYASTMNRYVNVDRFFQTVSTGDPLTLNYPWMDHPPLLGLITGGFAYISGVRVFEDATSYVIRKPIIVISTISVGLLMIYCYINFGFMTSVVGGLLYGTTPLVVLSGRMIQAENAIIPSLLLCMIFVSKYLKDKNDYWLFGVAFISGVATLFKLTGLVCYLFVFLTLFYFHKNNLKLFFRDILFFSLVSVPITFLFVVYGVSFGIDNFKNILFSNYNRFYGIGADSIIELIRNQRLTQHKYLPEVSIMAGWLVLLSFLTKHSKYFVEFLTVIALISYLIVYIFFGSQPYGWYTFPFWPLLIILLSRFLVTELNKRRGIFSVFFLLVLMLGANISRIMGIFEFQIFATLWRFVISFVFFGLIVISLSRIKHRWLFFVLFIVLFAMIISTNIIYLNSINIDYWWNNIS